MIKIEIKTLEKVTKTKILKIIHQDDKTITWEEESDFDENHKYTEKIDYIAFVLKKVSAEEGQILESGSTKQKGFCHTGSYCKNNEIYNKKLEIRDTEQEAIISMYQKLNKQKI